ncbi:MAG TPA: hypothetical protein VG759_06970 [Candidatus Angelobacter sp.]|jgi:hypothetical protein|nr:hypothetical protein [Candidatus Angelobacter sp.]
MRRLYIVTISLIVLICGCGGGGGGPGSTLNGNPQTSVGKIYVSNNPANSIVRFDNALTVTGNATPGATISGSATQLSSPQYMLLDAPNNRLFVANQGASSVLIFENASTKTGNVTPERTISGAATQLASPVDLALDSGRNLLYVADGSNILAFSSASTISGNSPPVRTIGLGFAASAIFFDGTNDRLFIADKAGNTVRIYDGASLLNGAVAANRILSGAATQLNKPAGLQLDTAGRLIVSNNGAPSITVYANAAIINGNVVPTAAISGSNTNLGAPTQMILNNGTTGGDLHVADGKTAAVLVFTNIAGANGNIAPARSISGSSTGLDRSAGGTGPFTATGIALDTTR